MTDSPSCGCCGEVLVSSALASIEDTMVAPRKSVVTDFMVEFTGVLQLSLPPAKPGAYLL